MKLHSILFLAAASLSLFWLAPGTRAAAPSVPTTAAAAPEAFVVDGGHSSVLFRIQHMNAGLFYGRFNEVEGRLTLDEAQPSNSSVEVTVQAASVDTNSAKRDQHVTSPDFLDAKQFPTISFKSESVSREGGLWKAEGKLTLHGVSKPLTFEFEKTGEAEGRGGKKVIGFHAELEVDRTEFGMDYGTSSLGAKLKLIVSLEAGAAE